MNLIYPYLFEFIAYVFFGLTLEIIFSVTGIERVLGYKLKKQTPHRSREGFVSLYMIPIHGFGVLFGVKNIFFLIQDFHIAFRFIIWSILISGTEVFTGYLYHKTIGFYPWDYYKDSKWKVFSEGYTLWTLIPLWGVAGLILEQYVSLIIKLSALYFGS